MLRRLTVIDKEKLIEYLYDCHNVIKDEFKGKDNMQNYCRMEAAGDLLKKVENGTFDAKQSACRWHHENAYSDHFSTECDNVHYFNDEGLKSSGFKHCPFCGKPIEEVENA